MEPARHDMHEVLRRQHGLITRRQVKAIGMTTATWRSVVRRGDVERAGVQTYRLTGAPGHARQRIMLHLVSMASGSARASGRGGLGAK